MTAAALPISPTDPVNAQILAVSEDRLQGFHPDPFGQIAAMCDLPVDQVLERIRTMLEAGVIRRVRQTLLATNLAPGSLVAWVVPPEKLDAAFEFMVRDDPFSGHVVIRSTDAAISSSRYKLWTTLKVPQGFSMDDHCRLLCRLTGATDYRLMPAKMLFALGVGHTRRKELEPGSKADEPAEAVHTTLCELTGIEWQVLTALKRELEASEIRREIWKTRAEETGLHFDLFCDIARQLDTRGVIGRFSTFLEHHKVLATGERVTRFNALFHWAVPPGREEETGREVGRFHVMTHAYWREGGPEFGNVNIMGVAHGTDKDWLLAHKAAIDAHLGEAGILVNYTNVFWGGRSEIKPSEISPVEYGKWVETMAGR